MRCRVTTWCTVVSCRAHLTFLKRFLKSFFPGLALFASPVSPQSAQPQPVSPCRHHTLHIIFDPTPVLRLSSHIGIIVMSRNVLFLAHRRRIYPTRRATFSRMMTMHGSHGSAPSRATSSSARSTRTMHKMDLTSQDLRRKWHTTIMLLT